MVDHSFIVALALALAGAFSGVMIGEMARRVGWARRKPSYA